MGRLIAPPPSRFLNVPKNTGNPTPFSKSFLVLGWDNFLNIILINGYLSGYITRAAVVHLNFRAGSTFPVPVCTVPSSMDRTSWCNKVDAVRLYASYRLNLLKGAEVRD